MHLSLFQMVERLSNKVATKVIFARKWYLCYFCGEEDTPRHAIYEFPACAEPADLRTAAHQGEDIDVEAPNLIARMLSGKEPW